MTFMIRNAKVMTESNTWHPVVSHRHVAFSKEWNKYVPWPITTRQREFEPVIAPAFLLVQIVTVLAALSRRHVWQCHLFQSRFRIMMLATLVAVLSLQKSYSGTTARKGRDGICGIMRVGSRNSTAISGLSLHKNGAALADTSTPWETWKYRWVYGKNIPNKASPVTWLSKFLATGNAPSQTTRLLVKVPAMLYFSVNCPSMRKVMFSFNREPRVI